ncbi:MAG: ABC-2 transporter permease [Lachnospiraceae bacterium]|nr:ABC-2 transporter permease [Lachnospiraceae bacterium]
MKGFLIKDYRLLLAQRNLLVIFPIGIIFMFTNDTPVMGISYSLYVLVFICTSLLSYDTFDNGMTHLMTLPGGRKNYVTAKYAFTILNASLAALLLSTIGSVLELSRGHGIPSVQETYIGTLMLYALALSFAFIILPIQLKYGPEKSRIVMLILFAAVFLGGMLVSFLSEKLHLNPDVFMNRLNQLSLGAIAVMVVLLAALFTIISWCISQKIMSKLEF